jgi:hypothetical protein
MKGLQNDIDRTDYGHGQKAFLHLTAGAKSGIGND